MMKRIVCIIGATATGKTGVGIELAKMLNAEIVSADSIQVYKGLDIGSAKPTLDERQGIPHHLLDCVDIDNRQFSVSEYRTKAYEVIDSILLRKEIPLIVGGTGLYINSLTYPLNFANVEADWELRSKLLEKEKKEPYALHELLTTIDPHSANRLHKNDTKRVLRALEVYYLTGKTLSYHGSNFSEPKGDELKYSPKIYGLAIPRELLYERINFRVDEMLKNGLIDEVKNIIACDYDPDLPALQGIGYKQLIAYFKGYGEATLEDTIELVKRETRRLAKRQSTWFKRDSRIHWIDILQFSSAKETAKHIERLLSKEQ